MTFTEIMILDVDCAHADESLRSRNDVRVSYILSNTPPEEWKDYFEEQASASANQRLSAIQSAMNARKTKWRYKGTEHAGR